MTTHEKNELNAIYVRRKILTRIRAGILSLVENRKRALIFGVFILVLLLIWSIVQPIFYSTHWSDLDKFTFTTNMLLWYVIIIVGILFCLGQPILAWQIHQQILCAGITNSAGEAPIFLNQKSESEQLVLIRFVNNIGIPIEQWEDAKQKIESALNITISEIRSGKNRYIVELVAVKGIYDYSKSIYWKEEQLTKDDAQFYLGESMGTPVTLSLGNYSHVLIGGATGSGKTILLKLLLMQCVKKKYQIYLADFKGGADYSRGWKEHCRLIYDRSDLVKVLQEIDKELQQRKDIFRSIECVDIDEYNQRHNEKMRRIIFACDEVAELLNIVGLDRHEVEQTREIRRIMIRIACTGRAFGIHLFLATQRPDSDTLQGQIKNNMDYRICGRADSVLSKIILDNTDAATMVPSNARGVFINHEGVVFKGYIFDTALLLQD